MSSYRPPNSIIDFYGVAIQWTTASILPRVETEFLPEIFEPYFVPSKVVWDICCGSGCIGLALKKNFDLNVTLSDISPECVTLSKQNAARNNLDVEVLQGDLFEPYKNLNADYIFCNPPYITESEYASLDLCEEPKRALVSGPTGLEFYERFQSEMSPYLNRGARLFFEIGAEQGEAIQEIFKGGVVKKDLAGHDRYFILET